MADLFDWHWKTENESFNQHRKNQSRVLSYIDILRLEISLKVCKKVVFRACALFF